MADAGTYVAKQDGTIKQFLYWGATAGIGYAAQAYINQGSPRQDTVAWVWLLTAGIAIIIYILWRSESARRIESRQHNDAIISRLDSIEKQQDCLLDAQQKVMRSDLIHRIERAVECQSITPEEHQAIMEEYGSYDSLGLNGYMKVYLDMLSKVKIRER